MKGPRLARDLREMVERLDGQLAVLEKHCEAAFGRGDENYLTEVAAKLRVLLVRSKSNTPLLFEVADRIGFTPSVTLSGPPVLKRPGEPGPGDTIPLDAFFDLDAVGIRTSAGFVMLTKRELIRAWAEQLGGAHEDWSVDEAIVNAIRVPIRIGGVQPTVLELRNSARTALQHGRDVVQRARTCGDSGAA